MGSSPNPRNRNSFENKLPKFKLFRHPQKLINKMRSLVIVLAVALLVARQSEAQGWAASLNSIVDTAQKAFQNAADNAEIIAQGIADQSETVGSNLVDQGQIFAANITTGVVDALNGTERI